MPFCKIVVCAEDNTDPAFPELTPDNTIDVRSQIYGMSILENGMVNGKTSIAIVIKTSDGKFVLAETSAAIFDMMHSALAGAEQRFLENKIQKQ